MNIRNIMAAAGPRSIMICTLGGLLAVGLLLAGCRSGSLQLAPVTAVPSSTPAESAAAAGSSGDWTEAGQVTVTPTLESTPDAGSTAGSTAGATATETSAGSGMPPGTIQPVQFSGKIENLPTGGDWSGPWQVGGRLVHVASSTTIDQRQGRVALGSFVTVEGWPRADSSIDADWIIVSAPAAGAATATPVPQQQAPPATATPVATWTPVPNAVVTAMPDRGADDQENKDRGTESQNNQANEDHEQNAQGNDNATAARPVEFRDVVQNMPGNGLVGAWQIGGRTVNVNARTRIQQKEGAFGPGAIVQVMGWQQPDGSINAAYLMVKKNTNSKGNAGNSGSGNGEDQGNDKGKGDGNGKGNGNGNGNGKGKGK